MSIVDDEMMVTFLHVCIVTLGSKKKYKDQPATQGETHLNP